MSGNYLISDGNPKLSTSISSKNKNIISYEIMHMEKIVATISATGRAMVYDEKFMPYDLYLESEEDTDVYWVRKKDENISFANVNLYDNTLNEAVVELSLKGRQMTVTNQELAPDLSTKGCFPKAWVRHEGGFRLLKDGGEDAVRRELLASKICQCFDVPQVKYTERYYDHQLVSESQIVTSKDWSMVSKMAFEVYACNHDMDVLEECKRIDPITFYGMNILDYLIGNTDRHPENWGVLVDNSTNEYVSLYPLMDFNQCFLAYDNIEGGICQTLYPRRVSQRVAAIEAVKKIGLRIISEIDMTIFGDMKQEADMFEKRLLELKQYK